MNKWLEKGSWGLPVVINGLVGACLFLANGMSLGQVWRDEVALTALTALYLWLLTRIPIDAGASAGKEFHNVEIDTRSRSFVACVNRVDRHVLPADGDAVGVTYLS